MGLWDIIAAVGRFLRVAVGISGSRRDGNDVEVYERDDLRIEYQPGSDDFTTASVDVQRHYGDTFLEKLWNAFTGDYISRVHYHRTLKVRFPPMTVPTYRWLPVVRASGTSWELRIDYEPAQPGVNHQAVFAPLEDYVYSADRDVWHLYFRRIDFANVRDSAIRLDYVFQSMVFLPDRSMSIMYGVRHTRQ